MVFHTTIKFKERCHAIEKLLSSGCKPLDDLLGGGFERGIVTQIFGAAGTGKTNVCIQLAVECVKQGQKVIFIDTEGLSPVRFKQIAGENAKEIARSIIIYEPLSFEEQYAAVREVERIAGENIGLVILDSATSYYRFELEDEETGIKSRRELANQIGFLHALARKHGFTAVITNQVYSNIIAGGVCPLGGSSLEHISKTIIQLEKTGTGTRRAILYKHRSRPEGSSAEFTITAEGLR
ncbi:MULTISPECIES: DNA repair and recombination protein RadB [unclassified Methanosarcina]|uniref:DNA repair and recombination protein RadB n=1 Tax=unclassified Methanosarcina TaxID=2644672 RepID=UPI0006160A14|nr:MULTISPECIES: DNA repair and recombination protein RadB [unclassified Methanosarcina]AKB20218.1 DNA repair and recombination protein RadB [Methanosarcina sp. WWM596]AKB23414.1 DNA repair and recombination protein RadB [Methanosarcina sp. WH1]